MAINTFLLKYDTETSPRERLALLEGCNVVILGGIFYNIWET